MSTQHNSPPHKRDRWGTRHSDYNESCMHSCNRRFHSHSHRHTVPRHSRYRRRTRPGTSRDHFAGMPGYRGTESPAGNEFCIGCCMHRDRRCFHRRTVHRYPTDRCRRLSDTHRVPHRNHRRDYPYTSVRTDSCTYRYSQDFHRRTVHRNRIGHCRREARTPTAPYRTCRIRNRHSRGRSADIDCCTCLHDRYCHHRTVPTPGSLHHRRTPMGGIGVW